MFHIVQLNKFSPTVKDCVTKPQVKKKKKKCNITSTQEEPLMLLSSHNTLVAKNYRYFDLRQLRVALPGCVFTTETT